MEKITKKNFRPTSPLGMTPVYADKANEIIAALNEINEGTYTDALHESPLPFGVDPMDWSVYYEDWHTAGFALDDELANESNPSGGKFSETADNGEYLVTVATVGEAYSITSEDNAPGGWLKIVTVATQNHPVSIQQNGTPWYFATGKPLYFETRIVVEDVSEAWWFVGLAIPNTDILASGAGTVDDITGFCGLGTTAIQFISNADNSDSINATAGTIADGAIATASTTAVKLAMYWDGVDTVNYYIDGVYIGKVNTAAKINSDEGMAISFVIDNQDGAAAEQLYIDYIYVAQVR
jgi:hypothetical protein